MIPKNVLRNIREIAAMYVRVSTEKDEQKDSPENQKGLCEEIAEDRNYDVQHYYEDRSSGTSITGRPEMKKLIEDAKKGKFTVVIMASLSRFSRDLADSLNLRRLLTEALGIRIYSIEENYDSIRDDMEMKFELYQLMNQNYAKQISIASRRGIKQSAKRGNFTGSVAPFGYKKVSDGKTKSLEIIPENAAIVQMIYNLYINHNMGEKKIINTLNDNGIPSPKDGTWGITTVQRILQNEAYTGRNVFGKYTITTAFDDLTNMEDRKKRLVQKDKSEWQKNEEKNWDPIIEDEIFEKAQEIRKLRGGGTRGGVKNVQVNPFAGILKCKHCGSNYVSMKSGKEGKDGQKYRYLICSSRRRMGTSGCTNGLWIPLHSFTGELLKQITDQFSKFIDVEEISKNVKMPKQNSGLNVQKEIERMNNLIAKRRKNLFNLRKMYLDEEMDKEQYEFEKTEYEKEIKDLQLKISKMENLRTKTNDEDAIRKKIKESLQRLAQLEFSEVAEMQFVLKELVDKVDVDENGKVEIYSAIGPFA